MTDLLALINEHALFIIILLLLACAVELAADVQDHFPGRQAAGMGEFCWHRCGARRRIRK
jgi:hypothetical protein